MMPPSVWARVLAGVMFWRRRRQRIRDLEADAAAAQYLVEEDYELSIEYSAFYKCLLAQLFWRGQDVGRWWPHLGDYPEAAHFASDRRFWFHCQSEDEALAWAQSRKREIALWMHACAEQDRREAEERQRQADYGTVRVRV